MLAALAAGWPLPGNGWMDATDDEGGSVPEEIWALARRYLAALFRSLQEGTDRDLADLLQAAVQELVQEARAGFQPASMALMAAHDLLQRRLMAHAGDGSSQAAALRLVARMAEHAQVVLAEQVLAERDAALAEERAKLRLAVAHSQTLRHVNRNLNQAGNEAEVLHALAGPALEAGAATTTLFYVDTDPAGEPMWAEIAATWQRNGNPTFPPGSRFYLPNFPSSSWLASRLDDLVLVANVASEDRLDDRFKRILAEEGIQALVLIPLSRPGRWIGFILFGWTEPHTFTEPEVEIYRALITRASSAVENRRLLLQTQQALDRIQRSERLLRSIIDTTPDWIFIKDRQHRFQLVNRSYAAAFHREPEEFVGKDNLEMGWPEELVRGNPKKGIRGIWTDDREVLDTGRTKLIRDELVAVNGELRVFNTVKIPLRDGEGRVWGLLGFARDITELKRAEEELERYRDHLERLVEQRTAQLSELNEQLQREILERQQAEQYALQAERLAAMGRLAAALAHEINNPLHAIANSLELVLDFRLTKKRQQVYLHAARREIERLMELSNRILDFARPPRLELQPTDIAEAVHRALTLAEKQLHSSNIQVSVDLPSGLPFVLASGDQLTQVFLNLIINATEEMPGGGTLRIAAQQIGERVELTFADSGPGIAPEVLPLIFEPFYTTKEDGTGLGLALSYSILQQYGGAITAGNGPEGGAVFTVSLPVGEGWNES